MAVWRRTASQTPKRFPKIPDIYSQFSIAIMTHFIVRWIELVHVVGHFGERVARLRRGRVFANLEEANNFRLSQLGLDPNCAAEIHVVDFRFEKARVGGA